MVVRCDSICDDLIGGESIRKEESSWQCDKECEGSHQIEEERR